MPTFHILNVYVDKTQPHQFKYTFNMVAYGKINTRLSPNREIRYV